MKTANDLNTLLRKRSVRTTRTGKQVGNGMNQWLRSKGEGLTDEQMVQQVLAKYPKVTLDHAQQIVAKFKQGGFND
jgi:hypothetical protein